VNFRQVIITAIILLLFALVGTALVVYTFDNTRERIAANERATLLRKLHHLIPPETHDNILLEDAITVASKSLSGPVGGITVYRARMADQPVALVMTPVAPDGYNGTIKLLVGIRADGTLSGVRVVAHRETPGLGDAIDEARSDWIHLFDNKSLENPSAERWKVRKDGGDFDQLTGATITPRAIVEAVRQTLLYYRDHQQALFAGTGAEQKDSKP
jgi:electron transport complex protein RnfG